VIPLAAPSSIDGIEDADIVRVILDRVSRLVPEADRAGLDAVELEVRAQYGGLRVRIPKRKKHLTAAQRDELYRDALSTMPTPEITHKYGITRRTLERAVKRPR
jgi:hypothetical protein